MSRPFPLHIRRAAHEKPTLSARFDRHQSDRNMAEASSPKTSCWVEANALESRRSYPQVRGLAMMPTAFRPSFGFKAICGILLFSGLALTPARSFAQRGGAGAHAGGARPGVTRAPQAPV